jgi:hypothetical protein
VIWGVAFRERQRFEGPFLLLLLWPTGGGEQREKEFDGDDGSQRNSAPVLPPAEHCGGCNVVWSNERARERERWNRTTCMFLLLINAFERPINTNNARDDMPQLLSLLYRGPSRGRRRGQDTQAQKGSEGSTFDRLLFLLFCCWCPINMGQTPDTGAHKQTDTHSSPRFGHRVE